MPLLPTVKSRAVDILFSSWAENCCCYGCCCCCCSWYFVAKRRVSLHHVTRTKIFVYTYI